MRVLGLLAAILPLHSVLADKSEREISAEQHDKNATHYANLAGEAEKKACGWQVALLEKLMKLM